MRTGGSVHARTTIPPLLALAAVIVGVLTMPRVMALLFPAGIRWALVGAELMLALPGLLALAAYRIPLRPGLALWPVDARIALLVAAAGASLWVASLGLLELQYTVWAPPAGYLEAFRLLHEALRPRSVPDALLSVVAIALVPALAEEVLVRGLVLPSLLQVLRPALAITASALVFALIHDPYRALFTLVLGAALGFLRLRTGSLLACILAHATFNTLTFATVPFTDDPTQPLPTPRPAFGLGLFALGTALTALVVRYLPSLTHPTTAPRLEA